MKIKTARRSFVVNYAIALIAVAITVFILDFIPSEFQTLSLVILLLLAIFLLMEPEVERVYREYHVLEEGVLKIEGFIAKKRVLIPYQGIADIVMKKGILGKILGFGDVIVNGFKRRIVIKGIRNVEEVYEDIKEKMERNRKKRK